MPSQRQETPHRPSRPSAQRAFATLLTLWMGSVSAQTVYRCDDQYTAHAAPCDKATTQTVQDTRSTAQEHAQQALTRKTQQEADALEKGRLNTERQNTQPTIPLAAFPQDKALAQSKLPPEPTNNPSSRGKRHAASPYFTAKDGSASNKSKSKNSAAKTKAATKP